MLDEGIVLLGCASCQGLEPVGVMGHSVLLGPLLHSGCHGVGDGAVKRSSVVHHVDELGVDICWQIFVHLRTVEYVLSEIFGRTLHRCNHFYGALLERLFNNLKS